MSDKFDVVIVGAGPSGLTAGYFLAKNGLDVVIVEKGSELGSKNVYGGRIYSHVLEKYFPEFKKEAPIERWIRKEQLYFMTKNSAVKLEFFADDNFLEESFTAHLTKFVQWLGRKTEDAGALIANGARVDSLIIENKSVKGVIAGEDKLEADYVIIAEGANTVLLDNLKFKPFTRPKEVALGVKEVFRLDSEKINERFGVSDEEGVAALLVGYPSLGMIGGGFLYTMKNEITLGVVVRLDEAARNKIKMFDIIEEFRMHPVIRRLLKDSYMIEYSAHLVVERGKLPEKYLVGNGYLVVGAAAGFELNTGLVVRGVDFAIESGRIAAETILKAHEKGDNSRDALSRYINELKESFVFRELEAFKNAPKFLSNKRIYSNYPELLNDFFRELLTVDGNPRRVYSTLRKVMRKKGLSLFRAILDGLSAVRSI